MLRNVAIAFNLLWFMTVYSHRPMNVMLSTVLMCGLQHDCIIINLIQRGGDPTYFSQSLVL